MTYLDVVGRAGRYATAQEALHELADQIPTGDRQAARLVFHLSKQRTRHRRSSTKVDHLKEYFKKKIYNHILERSQSRKRASQLKGREFQNTKTYEIQTASCYPRKGDRSKNGRPSAT